MTMHGASVGHAQARQIAGASGFLVIICAVVWRRLRAIVGSASAARAVAVSCVVGILMWAVLAALLRLLVRAVLG